MRIVLALAVIVGMGFAGAKIVRSGDIIETRDRLDAQLLERVSAVRAWFGSPSPSQPNESVAPDVASESSQPAADPLTVERNEPTYIASTGGVGVSLRSACRADARLPGGLAEGSLVTVVEHGGGVCQGWSRVSSGSIESWVHDQYLGNGGQRSLASSQSGS